MDALKRAETKEGLGSTTRRDYWWLEPVGIGLGLIIFVIYAASRAFEGRIMNGAIFIAFLLAEICL